MTNTIKTFIENYIDIIEQCDFKQLYEIADIELNNVQIKELYNVLKTADFDTDDDREYCLYSMLDSVCLQSVKYNSEKTVHYYLNKENTWFGYAIYEVIDFLEQMQDQLNVRLVSTHSEKVYNAPNYFIYEV